jgi:D-aminoacyl-tRNA deacylase
MRVLIQRVSSCKVDVDGATISSIGRGLLVFLGICHDDTEREAAFLAEKVVNLRIFPDDADKMNLSLKDLGLDLLVVSQFTLYANCLGGRRPDFINAAAPSVAEPLYEKFLLYLEEKNKRKPARGIFGATMQVHLINDGPVTLLIEKQAQKV